MNEGMNIKRYGDQEREEGVNYKHLSQAKVAGRTLRAVQLAQRSVAQMNWRTEMSSHEIQSAWSQFAIGDNGFREDDRALNENDDFRKLVVAQVEKILRQNIEFTERNDGRPASWLEAQATNEMVGEISRSIKRQIAGVEKDDRKRYRREARMRTVMGALSKWKGLWPNTPESQAEMKAIESEAARYGVACETLHTAMAVAWQELTQGTDSIFRRIHEETMHPVEGRTAILDLPIVGKMIRNLSASLIGGDDLTAVFTNPHIQECLDENASLTVAHEVESTYDEETAEINKRSFIECAEILGDSGNANTKFMSMKLSALGLYSQDPKEWDKTNPPQPNKQRVKARMREILDMALEKGIYVNIDMEYFIHKDVTFEIFKELMEEDEAKYADNLGMVFQAYLKDSPQDAEEMVKWAQDFKKRTQKRVNLRLVKGANLRAEAEHTELGVHEHFTTWHGQARSACDLLGDDQWKPNENTPLVKDVETAQVQYIEIMKLFEENTDCLNVRYGTMNPDTMAHILQTWLNKGENITERQIQMLFGMYNSLQKVLRKLTSMRVYVPYGILGMILDYMGRRFVEYERVQRAGGMPESRWTHTANPSIQVLAKVA